MPDETIAGRQQVALLSSVIEIYPVLHDDEFHGMRQRPMPHLYTHAAIRKHYDRMLVSIVDRNGSSYTFYILTLHTSQPNFHLKTNCSCAFHFIWLWLLVPMASRFFVLPNSNRHWDWNQPVSLLRPLLRFHWTLELGFLRLLRIFASQFLVSSIHSIHERWYLLNLFLSTNVCAYCQSKIEKRIYSETPRMIILKEFWITRWLKFCVWICFGLNEW